MGKKSKKNDRKRRPCSHGDFDPRLISPKENELYESQRQFLPPDDVLYVHLSEEKRGIDRNYVRSWYSIAAQDWREGRTEHALQKTELGIVAECWMNRLRGGQTHGQVSQEFMRLCRSPVHQQPAWFQNMMKKGLDYVRKSDDHLLLFLHSKLPCKCLERDFKRAEEMLKVESEDNLGDSLSCTHGENEFFTAESRDEIHKVFPVFCESTPVSPRDFDALCSFMESSPDLADLDYAAAAYSLAAQKLLTRDSSSTARRMFTLALTIDVFAKYGPEKVTADIATMDGTRTVEPYLREWYKILRQIRCDMRHAVILMSEKAPCGCLDETKELANELEREKICEGCEIVYPRDQFQTCFKCKIEMYCSKECQVKDWPIHKKMCKCLASALDE
jgi:hypothetical protein